MDPISRDFYKGIAKEMMGKLGRLKHFTSHGPSIGVYHEEILKTTIQSILPNRYSIKTGFAYCGDKNFAKQNDILIIDESNPSAYFFQEGDFVIVHPEAILCAIEVKTRLTEKEFHDGIENCYSLIKAAEITKSYLPITIIFAFDSPKLSPKMLHKWYLKASVPDEPKYYPYMIISLKKGRIELRRKPEWGHYFVIGEKGEKLKADSFSVFLAMIKKSLESRIGKKSNPFSYAHFKGQHWSRQYFRYKKGFIDPVKKTEK